MRLPPDPYLLLEAYNIMIEELEIGCGLDLRPPWSVLKRDGRQEELDPNKIAQAVGKCFKACEIPYTHNEMGVIIERVSEKIYGNGNPIHVEHIQDMVEQTLIELGYVDAARRYMRYRDYKNSIREKKSLSAADEENILRNKNYFSNDLAEFVFYRSYARWRDDLGRRETWEEAVDRVVAYFVKRTNGKLPPEMYDDIRNAMLNMDVLPSMRIMAMAGPALDRNDISAYNCSYVNIDSPESFVELLYILMAGTGAGYSVELYYCADKMPRVRPQKRNQEVETFVIPDTTEGWADALKIGLEHWFSGRDVKYDYSKVRPAGTRLKTKGGFASGPEPLRNLLDFCRGTILNKQGQKLDPIDLHDIACMIGYVVVSGGVRRSAEISLSDLFDNDMRYAKDGQFWTRAPHRSMANNSAVYEEKPSAIEFMEEWMALAKSGTGERGIFNRQAAQKTKPKRRKSARFGTNPCGEIILRPKQFCNLSEVIARAGDTREDLLRKTRIATIIGTIQSTFTNFPYLSPEWKQNCEEERLLGVSITGQMDCPITNRLITDPNNAESLAIVEELRLYAVEVNKEIASRLDINPSAAITCVKPSGTVSQLVNSSSGVHPRYSKYYIRRVRINAKDPLFLLARDCGVDCYPEVGETAENATTWVLEFPVKSPEGALTRHDISAMNQLEYWLRMKRNWAEHSVSCTVYVGEDEWLSVGNWVYNHFDSITGLSFLPRDNHVYQLAPYEEITEDRYNQLMEKFVPIDYYKLHRYEKEDNTGTVREYACTGDRCELL